MRIVHPYTTRNVLWGTVVDPPQGSDLADSTTIGEPVVLAVCSSPEIAVYIADNLTANTSDNKP